MAISANGSDKSIWLGAAETEILMGKGIRSILHRPSRAAAESIFLKHDGRCRCFIDMQTEDVRT
jgi:hypothetical protein